MDCDELISLTYDNFRRTGAWPLCSELQWSVGPQANVRLIAAAAGIDRVICEEGQQGRCKVTLRELQFVELAADDLEFLARSVALIARAYMPAGSATVGHEAIQTEFGPDQLQLRRLATLLRDFPGPWRASSWSVDDVAFSLTPGEDSAFFREVETFQDLVRVLSRIEDDRTALREVQQSYWNARRLPYVRSVEHWPKVERQFETARSKLLNAATQEEFQTVGLLCREILISLCEVTYESSRHRAYSDIDPSHTDLKRKLKAFFGAELAGGSNEEARGLAKSAVALANALQHERTADRRAAELCLEATLAVVRLAEIVERTRPHL